MRKKMRLFFQKVPISTKRTDLFFKDEMTPSDDNVNRRCTECKINNSIHKIIANNIIYQTKLK